MRLVVATHWAQIWSLEATACGPTAEGQALVSVAATKGRASRDTMKSETKWMHLVC